MERMGPSVIETYYYHTDGLGSIIALTDRFQQIRNSYTYDSFGNIMEETGSLVNPYTYTGREYDRESGLYYYRARYYDPSVGRFLSEDLFRGFAFSPQSFSFYSYCSNDPINFIDPMGLCGEKKDENEASLEPSEQNLPIKSTEDSYFGKRKKKIGRRGFPPGKRQGGGGEPGKQPKPGPKPKPKPRLEPPWPGPLPPGPIGPDFDPPLGGWSPPGVVPGT
ncbi:MAG: RHS repeat-associated core domain-containing protein, partial [Candidatus Omnitrophota bacterium]